jgi:hypothetical protein
MLIVPGALQKRFIGVLSEEGVQAAGQHGVYLKWLRYYLDFCQKYRFEEKQTESLAPFVRKLQEKRQSVMQLEQARKAIGLFFQVTSGDSCQISIGTAQSTGDTVREKLIPLRILANKCYFIPDLLLCRKMSKRKKRGNMR